MYYEEMMIDGILCWRSGPNDPWTRFPIEELSARAHQVARLTAELAQVQEERDELLENLTRCKGNELAEENEQLKEWATVDKKQLTEALQREARLREQLANYETRLDIFQAKEDQWINEKTEKEGGCRVDAGNLKQQP